MRYWVELNGGVGKGLKWGISVVLDGEVVGFE